jgi:hypothetical protein
MRREMMNLVIILGTILIESLLIWVVSMLLNWNFFDISFLGGVIAFGAIWLLQINKVQNKNQDHAQIKGMTGEQVGEIQVFKFKLNPILIGMVLYILVSGVATFIYYKDYFLG